MAYTNKSSRTNTTILERLVKGDRDMIDIEKCIVGELGGENHRCAFFRTLAYVKLRIAALYVPAGVAMTASFSDLQVVLTPTEEGAMVAVRRRFDQCLEEEDNECTPFLPCQKRVRGAECV